MYPKVEATKVLGSSLRLEVPANEANEATKTVLGEWLSNVKVETITRKRS